jgi:hypothetical protein
MYESIHTLPFHVFRKVIVTGDVSLVGEEKWEELLEQYADAIGETKRDGYLSTQRELLYFKIQRYLVDTLVEQLSKYYVPKWARQLNKLTRSNFKFNPHHQEEYYSLLERCLQRSKSIDIQIALAEEKLRELEKKNEGKNLAPTEEYFEKVLLNLHEWSNWQFDNSEISTFQYCELVRRYTQHISYMESQKHGRG